MKEFFSRLLEWFFLIALSVLALSLLCGTLFLVYLDQTKVEIDRYSLNSEITHCDYSYARSQRGQYSKYIVSIRNEEFTHTFGVSSTEYAKYKEGDFVQVEVTTLEDKLGNKYREYKILE